MEKNNYTIEHSKLKIFDRKKARKCGPTEKHERFI